jgi:hypothetical protein
MKRALTGSSPEVMNIACDFHTTLIKNLLV